MLPGPDILPGQSGSSPSTHPVQLRLPEVPLDRAACLRGGALAHQRTGRTGAPGTQIISGLSLHVMPSRFEFLSRRASVAVRLRVVREGLFREDPLAPSAVVLASLDVRDMGPQTPVMTGDVVYRPSRTWCPPPRPLRPAPCCGRAGRPETITGGPRSRGHDRDTAVQQDVTDCPRLGPCRGIPAEG